MSPTFDKGDGGPFFIHIEGVSVNSDDGSELKAEMNIDSFRSTTHGKI